MKYLWILFIAGQILNAGHTNYALENGYYEQNPIYGKHPSKQEIYIGKIISTAGIYGLTKAFPRHEKPVLIVANVVVWGVVIRDSMVTGTLSFRW